MKKMIALVSLLIAVVFAVGALAGCTTVEPKPTDVPEKTASNSETNTAAPDATDAPEPDETPAPEEDTPEPTEAPTPKPALGDEKGKPFAEGKEGVETLYFENFDEIEVDDLYDNAGTYWESQDLEIIDGKLCLSFVDGAPENQHQSFYPLLDDDFSDYEQFELSFDYKAAYTSPDLANYEWMGLMIGVFVSEPSKRIATNVGDGLFIGINNKGSFPIYGLGDLGEDGGWPDKALMFNYGQKDFFAEEHHVTLVETNEQKAYLYFDGNLVCSLEVGPEKVTLYDAAGTAVASRQNDPENDLGANMLVWTHCTGAVIDNYSVKAY